jgi:mono/diheme cytochrome c family protein
MPPLAGKDFLTNWTGKSVGDLFEKTHTTMPATAPGTLTPQQAADVVAHLLRIGQYPAGGTELVTKVEALAAIKLDPPRAGASATPSTTAGAARSVNDGVYSAVQAKRGEALYKEQCATCHGDNLEGSGPMPPLAGKDFLTNWTGKSVGDLFEKTHTTMPATAPGTLTPAQAADIVAHLLAAGKYPAGTAELGSKIEELMPIKIDAPKAP